MNKRFKLKRLIFLLFVGCYATGSAQSPFSKGVKRILFLGNSITYAGGYIVALETYFIQRYPNQAYEIINVGLPSETVSGLSEQGHAGGRFSRPDLNERLDRVLTKTRPDIVFAFYGMNDGIYLPLDEERFGAFKGGINKLHQKLNDAGVKRIIHLTPPVHDDISKRTLGYNRVLDVYAEWLLEQVKEQQWEVIDIHGPMTKYLNDGIAKDAGFRLAKDGIHPEAEGHWFMAKIILRALKQSVDDDFKKALLSTPNDDKLYRLVANRQEMMKDAWLSATGHTRPEMKKGLPLREARKQSKKIEKEIRRLVKSA